MIIQVYLFTLLISPKKISSTAIHVHCISHAKIWYKLKHAILQTLHIVTALYRDDYKYEDMMVLEKIELNLTYCFY